jgi:hypothetical protein
MIRIGIEPLLEAHVRISVRVDRLASRLLSGLAANFEFELLSPHVEDKDHSNNSSIVLKLTGIGPSGFSYLITGNTENERWEQINRFYGTSLRSSVLSAPHHRSRGAANAKTLLHISPNTVLISAGVDSQYGHPNSQAIPRTSWSPSTCSPRMSKAGSRSLPNLTARISRLCLSDR